MKPLERFELDVELATRLLSHLPVAGRKAEAMISAIRAHAYDIERGGSVVWCDTHDREVHDCHDHDLLCEGVPLPRVSDPTGDAAAAAERILADARQAVRRMNRIGGDVDWLVGFVNRYDVEDPTPATTRELLEQNEVHCARHLRYGWTIKADTKQPTKVKHKGRALLLEALLLCTWCRRRVVGHYETTGSPRLPTEQEIRLHAEAIGAKRIVRAAA